MHAYVEGQSAMSAPRLNKELSSSIEQKNETGIVSRFSFPHPWSGLHGAQRLSVIRHAPMISPLAFIQQIIVSFSNEM